MSTSVQEHNYIGLSEAKMEIKACDITTNTNDKKDMNLKATELRLGLPGSESPERKVVNGGVIKNLVTGAKRGFSDTINGGTGKWIFASNGGNEAELVKNGGCAKENVVLVTPKPVLMEKKSQVIGSSNGQSTDPAPKQQVVGWPPVHSFRKNTMVVSQMKNKEEDDLKVGSAGCHYVKVSMDGAPYLRKVDLEIYSSYLDLSFALEKMFSCFTIGQYGSHGAPTKDGLCESQLVDLLHGSEYVLIYEDKDSDWMLIGDVPWDMFIGSCKRMRS